MTRANAEELGYLYGREFGVVYQGGLAPPASVAPRVRCQGPEVRIFSLCRLNASKHLDWIVRALADWVASTDPPLQALLPRVILAGTGPAMESLQALAGELGVAELVEFPGFLTQEAVEVQYAQADVVAVPGRQGYGLPVLEALYRGVPVVLSRESRVSEILETHPLAAITEHSASSYSAALRTHVLKMRHGSHHGQALPSCQRRPLGGMPLACSARGGEARSLLVVNGTPDADTFALDGSDLRFGAMAINQLALENLTVAGGAGDDTLSVTGTVTGNLRLLGQGGGDTVQVIYPVVAGSLSVDGGGGPADMLFVTLTDDAETVTLGGSTISVAGGLTTQYLGFSSLTLDTRDGADTVTVLDTHAGTTQVNTSAGADTVTIAGSSGLLGVNTGDEDGSLTATTTDDGDTVYVRAIGANLNLDLGAGDDTLRVSSTVSGAGNLTGISATLSMIGGAGTDVMTIDAAADTVARTGALSESALDGLGMAGGISYSGVEDLSIALGSGADDFTIASTHSGATSVTTGAGADFVRVGAVAGATSIATGADADRIDVTVNRTPDGTGDDAGGTGFTAGASPIAARLTIDGGGQGDTLNVTSGSVQGESGNLTSTSLTGLGMAEGIGYAAIETLNIALGSGGDTFTIESSAAATSTSLAMGDGMDTVNVQAMAGTTNVDTGGDDDTIHVGTLAPVASGGTLNAIGALLTLNGGAGTDAAGRRRQRRRHEQLRRADGRFADRPRHGRRTDLCAVRGPGPGPGFGQRPPRHRQHAPGNDAGARQRRQRCDQPADDRRHDLGGCGRW